MTEVEDEATLPNVLALEVGSDDLPSLKNSDGLEMAPGFYYWFEYEGFPPETDYVGPYETPSDALTAGLNSYSKNGLPEHTIH